MMRRIESRIDSRSAEFQRPSRGEPRAGGGVPQCRMPPASTAPSATSTAWPTTASSSSATGSNG